MAYRGGGGAPRVKKVMTQAINLMFEFLKNVSNCSFVSWTRHGCLVRQIVSSWVCEWIPQRRIFVFVFASLYAYCVSVLVFSWRAMTANTNSSLFPLFIERKGSNMAI
jgi:hypothetical protein